MDRTSKNIIVQGKYLYFGEKDKVTLSRLQFSLNDFNYVDKIQNQTIELLINRQMNKDTNINQHFCTSADESLKDELVSQYFLFQESNSINSFNQLKSQQIDNLKNKKDQCQLISISNDVISRFEDLDKGQQINGSDKPPLNHFELDATQSQTQTEAEKFCKVNNLFLVSLRGLGQKESLEIVKSVLSLRLQGLIRRNKNLNLISNSDFEPLTQWLLSQVNAHDIKGHLPSKEQKEQIQSALKLLIDPNMLNENENDENIIEEKQRRESSDQKNNPSPSILKADNVNSDNKYLGKKSSFNSVKFKDEVEIEGNHEPNNESIVRRLNDQYPSDNDPVNDNQNKHIQDKENKSIDKMTLPDINTTQIRDVCQLEQILTQDSRIKDQENLLFDHLKYGHIVNYNYTKQTMKGELIQLIIQNNHDSTILFSHQMKFVDQIKLFGESNASSIEKIKMQIVQNLAVCLINNIHELLTSLQQLDTIQRNYEINGQLNNESTIHFQSMNCSIEKQKSKNNYQFNDQNLPISSNTQSSNQDVDIFDFLKTRLGEKESLVQSTIKKDNNANIPDSGLKDYQTLIESSTNKKLQGSSSFKKTKPIKPENYKYNRIEEQHKCNVSAVLVDSMIVQNNSDEKVRQLERYDSNQSKNNSDSGAKVKGKPQSRSATPRDKDIKNNSQTNTPRIDVQANDVVKPIKKEDKDEKEEENNNMIKNEQLNSDEFENSQPNIIGDQNSGQVEEQIDPEDTNVFNKLQIITPRKISEQEKEINKIIKEENIPIFDYKLEDDSPIGSKLKNEKIHKVEDKNSSTTMILNKKIENVNHRPTPAEPSVLYDDPSNDTTQKGPEFMELQDKLSGSRKRDENCNEMNGNNFKDNNQMQINDKNVNNNKQNRNEIILENKFSFNKNYNENTNNDQLRKQETKDEGVHLKIKLLDKEVTILAKENDTPLSLVDKIINTHIKRELNDNVKEQLAFLIRESQIEHKKLQIDQHSLTQPLHQIKFIKSAAEKVVTPPNYINDFPILNLNHESQNNNNNNLNNGKSSPEPNSSKLNLKNFLLNENLKLNQPEQVILPSYMKSTKLRKAFNTSGGKRSNITKSNERVNIPILDTKKLHNVMKSDKDIKSSPLGYNIQYKDIKTNSKGRSNNSNANNVSTSSPIILRKKLTDSPDKIEKLNLNLNGHKDENGQRFKERNKNSNGTDKLRTSNELIKSNSSNSFIQINKDNTHNSNISLKYVNSKTNLECKFKDSNSSEYNINRNSREFYDSLSIQSSPILFKINIKLGGGNEGKVLVRRGESMWKIAQKFAITHKLDNDYTEKVQNLILEMYNDWKQNQSGDLD